jgi:uncharacterized membrane protein YphA (DoxX/SURF4 family)
VGSKTGLDAVAKRKIPLHCRETKPGCPARSLFTVLAELPRLLVTSSPTLFTEVLAALLTMLGCVKPWVCLFLAFSCSITGRATEPRDVHFKVHAINRTDE